MKYLTLNNILKLTAISALFGASVTSLASLPFGVTPTGGAGIEQQLKMVKLLSSLNKNVQVVGNRIQSAAEAQIRLKNDPGSGSSTTQASTGNILLASNKVISNEALAKANADEILKQLQPLSIYLLSTGSNVTNGKNIADIQNSYKQAAVTQSLTSGILASDSIYSNDPTVQMISISGDNLSKLQSIAPERKSIGLPKDPNELHNDYFNFSTLIQPLSYTTPPAKDINGNPIPVTPLCDGIPGSACAPNMFVKYVTKDYLYASNPLQKAYDNFNNKLNNAKGSSNPQQAMFNLYYQFIKNPLYQQYALATRSQTAANSVAQGNFQKMITERTPTIQVPKNINIMVPVKCSAQEAQLNKCQLGDIMKDKNGNPIMQRTTTTSPLALQHYQATHRISDPMWYTNIKSASSAALQRETLVVLAEIEAQNFQAHLDRERLLATMSTQMAQSAALLAEKNITLAGQVAEQVKNFSISNPDQTQPTSSPQDQAAAAKAQQQEQMEQAQSDAKQRQSNNK